MSYFRRAQDVIIENSLEFGTVTENTLQQFDCVRGEIAGFQIVRLGEDTDGKPLFISQIFDCTSGDSILIGQTQVLPGIDLTGGYFSSGCFPDREPLDPDCNFFKVDYVEAET